MKTNPSLPARPKVNSVPLKVAPPRFILKLFVVGQSPKSVSAISNLHQNCEEKLHGRYELDVIDLYQQPQLARGEQIVAVPTLIRKLPSPLRRIIGDMSNTERVLAGLDMHQI